MARKKKKQKRYFDKHEGLYIRQECVEELERISKYEKPVVIDDLDAWFKENFGV